MFCFRDRKLNTFKSKSNGSNEIYVPEHSFIVDEGKGVIKDNCNVNSGNTIVITDNYECPPGFIGYKKTYLAGSGDFKVTEIETYEVL